MAGAKETPRQKLISLMYLVFITMLALNVSKEVLDGFGQMYVKISDANTRVDESNDNIYENIKTAKLKTNKIKNLGLLYEENDEGVMVFAGPFPNNDIDLKLDFLIKNGYINAKKNP
mgnify:CR=1 FL=1